MCYSIILSIKHFAIKKKDLTPINSKENISPT